MAIDKDIFLVCNQPCLSSPDPSKPRVIPEHQEGLLNNTQHIVFCGVGLYSTVCSVIVLHMDNPGVIADIPFGPLRPPSVIPECRTKTND